VFVYLENTNKNRSELEKIFFRVDFRLFFNGRSRRFIGCFLGALSKKWIENEFLDKNKKDPDFSTATVAGF
jgi:hypothetical protein